MKRLIVLGLPHHLFESQRQPCERIRLMTAAV